RRGLDLWSFFVRLVLVDTHAHLDELEDLDEAVARAQQAGVRAIVAVGSDLQSNVKTLDIASRYPGVVYPALGLHPWRLQGLSPQDVDAALDFIERHLHQAVAVGEIGLDYDKRAVKAVPKDRQQEVLRQALALAVRHGKPVSLHTRYAWKDALAIVKESGVQKAVFHWFTGFSSVLRELLAAGYYISATPAAEYHEEHHRAIREAPPDRLLLETDCPVDYGREVRFTSQPHDLVRSLQAAAAVKNIDPADLARQTTANAAAVFGIRGTDYGQAEPC
ncbi:MAG: TatD family hydrolase, partial [Chloroflexota bacterium]